MHSVFLYLCWECSKGGDEEDMIRLERISGKNDWEILRLRVSESQRSFVASNDISLIEAYVAQNEYGHAFPFGMPEYSISDDGVMVHRFPDNEYMRILRVIESKLMSRL